MNKQQFQGTPLERELFHALVIVMEAADGASRGKPEDWQRLGRAKYIGQLAIDRATGKVQMPEDEVLPLNPPKLSPEAQKQIEERFKSAGI